MFASTEHAWDPMASSSVKSCSKTRTVPSAKSSPSIPVGMFGLPSPVAMTTVRQLIGALGVLVAVSLVVKVNSANAGAFINAYERKLTHTKVRDGNPRGMLTIACTNVQASSQQKA
jgi:hypothetical protein